MVEDDGFEPPNREEEIYSLPRLATSLILHNIISVCQKQKKIKWWLGTESNRRHEDFQSSALPTELPSLTLKKKMAELTGFEPAVSCVTGRHVRPLHHSSEF
jgi:hypothetical protein